MCFLQFLKGPVKLDNLLNTYPHGLENEKKNHTNFFQLDTTVAELVLLRIVSLYEFSIFWSIITTNSFPVTKEKSLIFRMKSTWSPRKPNFLIMWKAAFVVVKNMNSGFQPFRFES